MTRYAASCGDVLSEWDGSGDGTLWQLELFSGTNVIRRIRGDNAAPPEFKKFCTVKQVAFDKFGGCSLWYPKQRDEMMKLIEAAEKKAVYQ